MSEHVASKLSFLDRFLNFMDFCGHAFRSWSWLFHPWSGKFH